MERTKKAVKETETVETHNDFVNPLRMERIFIRFVPQRTGGNADSKNHVLFGGLADGASITLCVPVLRSTGNYKNILTNDEKKFLEHALGLDYGALSVYKKENNYWDNYFVTLTKEGVYLDLSDPEDYIKYAVIRANTDTVAPSVEELERRPKATYRFVIVRQQEETSLENVRMDATMQSYKEFGKIESDPSRMRVLIELLDGKPYAINTKVDFLRSRINMLIQVDPKKFLSYITDPYFPAKVTIRRATEEGLIAKRGDYYYLKSDGSPLCDNGQDPTLSIAAKYISSPAHQDIKFLFESEIDKK